MELLQGVESGTFRKGEDDLTGYSSSPVTPRSRKIISLRYLRSPREFIRIAGSLPFLPQRFIVSGDTRRMSATSRIVKRSGKSSSDTFGFFLLDTDMEPYYRGGSYGCQGQDISVDKHKELIYS